jgi:exosome complex component RRP4
VHTRSLKYGKLVSGELIVVQPSLIKRSRSHFLLLDWGVEVILGVNGYVWIGKPRKAPDQQDLDAIYSPKLEPISREERVAICRTRNCILALNSAFILIDEDSICRTFDAAASWDIPLILGSEFSDHIKAQ